MITQPTYVADFETITRTDGREHVWCWDVCNLITLEHTGDTTIESFIDYINGLKFNSRVYFHNLKFDAGFILDFFANHGYTHIDVKDAKYLKKFQYNSIITEMGQFIKMVLRNGRGKMITILDSLKVLPMKCADVAKAFDLPIAKGEIDYNMPRPVGYIPTDEEWSYVHNDTEIIARALRVMIGEGLSNITISACAFDEYRKIISKKYKTWFGWWENNASLDLDSYIRKAYRGGFCQPNPDYTNKIVDGHIYYHDVNSLYPYVMSYAALPYGEPKAFDGEYQYDPDYPYYVQRIRVDMSVKEDGVPCILWKRGIASEYITDTLDMGDGLPTIELTVTNFDLELIYKNYEIYHLEFLDGYKFKVRRDIFADYISKYNAMKEEATRQGNKGRRQIAKLMNNSLYGKFGQNPRRRKKEPYMEDGVIKFRLGDEEIAKKKKYLPIAVFITAIARYKILTEIGTIGKDNWLYSDTDSIISSLRLPDELIHPTQLGKYDIEYEFKKFKVLGPKTYCGITLDDKKVIKACGCNKEALNKVSIEDFNYDAEVENGRVTLKRVEGGTKIVFGPFKIRNRNKMMKIRETKEKPIEIKDNQRMAFIDKMQGENVFGDKIIQG